MKNETVNFLESNKLTVSLRAFPSDTLLYTAEALINGGITSIETDFDSSDEKSEKASVQKIAALKKCFGKDIKVGAGMVRTDRQVRYAKGAGADFITAPNVVKEVLERAGLVSVVSVAGAFTATEIENATAFGADFVGLFPSKIGGNYDYAALIYETFPEVKFVGTGNLDFADIAPLSKIGITRFIIGGSLANRTLAEKREFGIITNEAKRYIDIISQL